MEGQVKNLPTDWWQRSVPIQYLIKEFSSYVIGLLLGGSVGGKFKYDFFTGFLVEQNKKVLWMTAGHVIDSIEYFLTYQRPSVMRWFDGCDLQGAESIPINYASLKMKSWISLGFDVGLIVISLLEKENILANKNKKIMNEGLWKSLKQATPEGYYVIGYPKIYYEFKEKPVEKHKVLRSLRADITCIPVQNINPPMDACLNTFWNKKNAFYGQLLDKVLAPESYVEDIKYMSGGPIISIERTPDGKFLYRLAGILTKWLPESRIICAEPIDEVAIAVSSWL